VTDTVAFVAPRAVVLLILSPWLALLTTWWGASDARQVRSAALTGAWGTALLATAVWLMSALTGADGLPAGWGLHGPHMVWPAMSTSTTGMPWRVEWSWSLGIDPWSAPLLLAIPWLVVIALGLVADDASASRGLLRGLLALEGCYLLTAAAQDAVTAAIGVQGAILLTGLLTGWYGATERRTAAETYWRWQQTAHLLWCVAVVGLALAAVWVQQEIVPDAHTIRFRWYELGELLLRFTSRYLTSAHYWGAVQSILLWLLLLSGLIRLGLFPGHTWWPAWIQDAPLPLGLLQLGAGGLIGGLLHLRLLAPLLREAPWEREIWSTFALVTTLLAALLALAQTDLRKLMAYAWLSTMSSTWVGTLRSGGPGHLELVAWLPVISGGVGGLVFVQFLETRYQTRDLDAFGGLARKLPRLAFAGALLIGPWITLPALGRGLPDLDRQTYLLAGSAWSWWLVVASRLLVAWAVVWMLQRVCLGRLREPLPDPGFGAADQLPTDWAAPPAWHAAPPVVKVIHDLTWPEGIAVGLLMLLPWVPWSLVVWGSLP
jgi:NADH-quinone oxidoreductase subunit M